MRLVWRTSSSIVCLALSICSVYSIASSKASCARSTARLAYFISFHSALKLSPTRLGHSSSIHCTNWHCCSSSCNTPNQIQVHLIWASKFHGIKGSPDLGNQKNAFQCACPTGLLQLGKPITVALGEVHSPHSYSIVLRQGIRDHWIRQSLAKNVPNQNNAKRIEITDGQKIESWTTFGGQLTLNKKTPIRQTLHTNPRPQNIQSSTD